jgi:hypothetical protein
MRQRIVGTWLVCATPSLFGTDEAGMLIDSTGHWAKLRRDAAGHLVASTAPREHGTWEIIDSSEMNGRPTFQVDFTLVGNGGDALGVVVTVPEFAKAVARVYLDNNGVYAADYVLTSEPVS